MKFRSAILVGSVLFTAARTCVADGIVSGTVREGDAPSAFAVVTLVGTRLGAQTGEDGRYTIHAVPAGRYIVRAMLLGFPSAHDTVTVRDGETTVSDLALQVPKPPERPKDWHPPSPPSKVLLGRLERAGTVRVLRVTQIWGGGGLELSQFDVLSRRVLADRGKVRRFVRLLGRRDSFDAGFAWDARKLCSPRPGVVVQFEDEGIVEVFLCFECEMVWVVVPGEGTVGGDFDRQGRAFVRWIKEALPDDPVIQALREPTHR